MENNIHTPLVGNDEGPVRTACTGNPSRNMGNTDAVEPGNKGSKDKLWIGATGNAGAGNRAINALWGR